MRHWRGQLEPMTAALGTGLMVSALLIAAMRVLVWGSSATDLSLQAFAAVEIGFYVGTLCVVLWAATGVLRTARRVRGATGRILAIFAIACIASLIPVGLRTLTATQELALLAVGRDPLGPPATMTRIGATVLIEGMLSLGSAEKFAKFVPYLKEGDVLTLNSPGGRLAEADKIAKVVARLRLKTHVNEECSSACTILMLAGRDRSADVGARIGFHQPTQDGNNAIDDKLSAESLREFYLAAKVNPEFVEEALSKASDDLWYPESDELERAGVIGKVTFDYRLHSLAAFFESEETWSLDKDFLIVGAATDGSSLDLRYQVRPGSRFQRSFPEGRSAQDQLIESSCKDEDFLAVLDHGARIILRPREGQLPTLTIEKRDCRNS